MNKEVLRNQVQEMEDKLAEMKALLLEPDVVINYFQPEANKSYFCVNHFGCIFTSHDNKYANKKYRIFKTEQEAEIYAEYVKAEETLREAIAIANNGWLPDWNNKCQSQWFIYFNYCYNRIETTCSYNHRQQPNFMYCETEVIAKQIINNYEKELRTYYSY